MTRTPVPLEKPARAGSGKPARNDRAALARSARSLLPFAALMLVVALLVTAIGAAAAGRTSASPPPAVAAAPATAAPTPAAATPKATSGATAGATPVPSPTREPVVIPAPAGFRPEFTGGPRLVVDRPDIFLGTLLYGAPARTLWTLKNVGDATLTVKLPETARVVEGCCPPSVLVGSTVLKPGESTPVVTEFSMHQGMGGVHQFSIAVSSDDPVSPTAQLRVFSTWVPPAGAKP